jgi:hypothetical protein
MFSLQKLLGKDDKFFGLLEASATEARHCVQALTRILSAPTKTPSLQEFHQSKEADKKITEQINEALVTTFVSQLEREDIEVLSAALYKIPKTVEKFTERFIISAAVVKGIDFSRHIALLDAATGKVVELVSCCALLAPANSTTPKRSMGNSSRSKVRPTTWCSRR